MGSYISAEVEEERLLPTATHYTVPAGRRQWV